MNRHAHCAPPELRAFAEKIAAPGAECETDIPELARMLRAEGVNVTLVDKEGKPIPIL